MSKNLKKRIYTSLMLLLLFFLVLKSNFILVFTLIVLGVLSSIEFLNLTKKILKNKLYLIISNSFFITYIFIFCFIFLFFSNYIQLKIILFSLLFGCIASDTGGFIFGKIWFGVDRKSGKYAEKSREPNGPIITLFGHGKHPKTQQAHFSES